MIDNRTSIVNMMPEVKKQEYLWHLFYENKTSIDLSYKDHVHWDEYYYSDIQCILYELFFIKFNHLFNNKRILDIGCCIGEKLLYGIHNNIKSYVGIDINHKFIELAHVAKNLIENNIDIELIVNDAIKLDYTTYNVDTITILGVLSYMKCPEEIFKSLKKSNATNIIIEASYNTSTQWEEKDEFGTIHNNSTKEEILNIVSTYWNIIYTEDLVSNITNGNNRILIVGERYS